MFLRVHYFSTDVGATFHRRLQQPDRRIQRSRAEVHVPLRRPEILMAGEFLDGRRRCAAHRQVRTERVAEDVNSRFDARSSGGPPHQDLGHFPRQGLPTRRAG